MTIENVIFGCDAEYRASKSKDGKSPTALKTTSDALPSSLWTHLRVQVSGNAEAVGTWSRSLARNT
jgi:hypothetical protein